MGKFLKTQYAFSSGEIAPEFYATNNVFGLSVLENMDVLQSGGLKRRAGLKKIKNVASNSILVPFVISESEKYLLVICESSIDVFQNDVKITTLLAPWHASELKNLQMSKYLSRKANKPQNNLLLNRIDTFRFKKEVIKEIEYNKPVEEEQYWKYQWNKKGRRNRNNWNSRKNRNSRSNPILHSKK